jgi:hypothetical protein
MENRVRMVAACFLVKDLMLDWRKCCFDGSEGTGQVAEEIQDLARSISWRVLSMGI